MFTSPTEHSVGLYPDVGLAGDLKHCSTRSDAPTDVKKEAEFQQFESRRLMIGDRKRVVLMINLQTPPHRGFLLENAGEPVHGAVQD